jgi:thiol:disulfide interchange protein
MRMVLALFLALLAAAPGALAANTTARLVLAAETVKPGDTVLAGVHLKMDGNWHTYWRNPGESGGATRIQWQLPPGITAGETQWPVPERYLFSGLTTFVHHNEALLLVPLTIAKDTAPGAKELKAMVDWLECEKLCLPAKQDVSATLIIGAETKPSADAGVIEAGLKRLPVADGAFRSRAWWEGAATTNDTRALIVELFIARDAIEPGFFPYEGEDFEVAPASEELPATGDSVRLRLTVKKSGAAWPKEFAGVILAKAGAAGPAGFEVKLRPADQPPADAGSTAMTSAAVGAAKSLPLMLLFAFIGGLILNIMPCVLPVIALKVLGFVQQSKESPATVRRHGIVYTLGVLCSFLVLAGVVIGVQQAGKLASWGMQFGNPTFVVAMTVLVTLVALNLFGVFEIFLGGGAMTAASQLASKEGNAGAFFNGVLATALATPCTAPFLGAALGFAFSQPPVIVLLMFLVVGFGLAVPYLLLSWNPAWMKFLPKPGAWMEKFKIAMGFPMLATAAWLAFSVGAAHFGKQVFWLGIFLVLLALAAWIWGEFVQRGRKRVGLARGISLVILVSAYVLILEHELHWRAPVVAQAGGIEHKPGGVAWEPWSPEAVAKARAEGRPVFVDFTADWCVTCQANKKTSIEISSVIAKLKEINAVALLGDYTLVPDSITRELQKFGRAGVPLVLVYPRDATKPPQVLPELLTPGIVLEALEQAGR